MKRTPGNEGREHARGHVGRPAGPTGRRDDGNAFVPDNMGTLEPLTATDAESFGEEFVASALTNDHVVEQARDEVVDDEEGGPFIVLDDDASLPTEPEEGGDEAEPEREGHEDLTQKQKTRAARWAARGG